MLEESQKNLNILLIDKPTGITSHDVVNRVRRQTGVKRVGHAGTLDPLATGLLIVLVGRDSTKLQSNFLHMDKEYECTAQLGVETDTYDSEGTVVKTADWEKVASITQEKLEKVLPSFTGKIQQQVPAYSAVKVKGQKLYEQARRGKVIENLPVREVEVFSLQLTDFTKNEQQKMITFSIRVHCSSGTYIRSLIFDIGRVLGCGATVTALRRTKIGPYSVEEAQAY